MSDKIKRARIYRLHDKLTGDVTFVRAGTATTGLNYATRDRFTMRVAEQDDLLGIDPKSVLDATRDGVHPDQQPLDGV